MCYCRVLHCTNVHVHVCSMVIYNAHLPEFAHAHVQVSILLVNRLVWGNIALHSSAQRTFCKVLMSLSLHMQVSSILCEVVNNPPCHYCSRSATVFVAIVCVLTMCMILYSTLLEWNIEYV